MPCLNKVWLVYTAKHFFKDLFMEKSLNAFMLIRLLCSYGSPLAHKLHNLNSAHLWRWRIPPSQASSSRILGWCPRSHASPILLLWRGRDWWSRPNRHLDVWRRECFFDQAQEPLQPPSRNDTPHRALHKRMSDQIRRRKDFQQVECRPSRYSTKPGLLEEWHQWSLFP